MHSHRGKKREKRDRKKCSAAALSSKAVHLLCTAPCLAQLSAHQHGSPLVMLKALAAEVKLFLNCISCIFNCVCSQMSITSKVKSYPFGRSRWWAAEFHPAALTNLRHVLLTDTLPRCLLHNTMQTGILSSGYYEIKGSTHHHDFILKTH